MSRKKVIRFIRKLWKDWWKTVVFIVFVIIPLKSSIADWNWVPTGSMNPTILEGDLVYVDKLAYDLRIPLTFHRLAKWSQPQRGDIVICFSPEDGTRLVKRIIALPGDTVEMRANALFINGQPISYTRIDAKNAKLPEFELKKRSVFATEDLDGCEHTVMSVPSLPAIRDFGPFITPTDSYFVMGDNRDMSRDSRYFGFVERKAIIGKAKAVIVSLDTADKYRLRPERIFTSLK
jgi:signal peptidase I